MQFLFSHEASTTWAGGTEPWASIQLRRRRPKAVDRLAISSQSPFRIVGENFAIGTERDGCRIEEPSYQRSYAAFFFAALNFAHLARCAAAILFRAAADIVLFLGMLTTFCFCSASPRTFAHRALCAAAILALPAGDKCLRCPVLFPYEPPLSASSATSRHSMTPAAR